MISRLQTGPLSMIQYILLIILSMNGFSGCVTHFQEIRNRHALEFTEGLEEKSNLLIIEKGSLDLDTCIDIALENNLDIKIAHINGRLSGIGRNIAFSRFLPRVDFEYSHLENDKQQLHRAGTAYMATSDQDITQKVISGQIALLNPATWFMYNAYKKGEEIQLLLTERVKQAIRLQVTSLYIACLTYEVSGKAIESSLDQAKNLVREMESLAREGLILESERKEAKVFLASQENRLEENHRLKSETKAQLLEAMGLSPLAEITLWGLPHLSIRDEDISAQVLRAMLNRLELKVSDREISIRRDLIHMTIANFLPKISLFSNYTNSSNSFYYYENILSYGISGLLALFDGFTNIQAYKEAKEKQKQAMVKREQLCMKIMLEVISARNQLDRVKDRQKLMKLELDASKRRLRETRALWREGMALSSDKLRAVAGFVAAEANANLADYHYQVAVATMRDVMGLSGKE